MKSVLAFAGSNSSTSINHKLVAYAASQLKDIEVTVLNMSELEFPMYSQDIEKEGEFPEQVSTLHARIRETDALLISLNEHNNNFSAYFKNVIDWLSRLDRKFLEGKKVLLLATSPGGRGASSALKIARHLFPRLGAEVINIFTFPSFYDNFSLKENTIIDKELNAELEAKLLLFAEMILKSP